MKFLLEQASDHNREDIVEIDTLEQLLELVSTEMSTGSRHGTWPAAIIVRKVAPLTRFPGVEWGLEIYDSWLEL